MAIALDRLEVIDDGPFALPMPVLERRVTFPEAVEEVHAALESSVRLHLRSDVPVGVCLSGGIDSTAIAAMARRLLGPSHPIHSFSFVAADPSIDEERWIDLAASELRLTSHKVRLDSFVEASALDQILVNADEPFATTSIVAQAAVFRCVAETGIKVVLDGQGADEILGGSRYLVGARVAHDLARGHIGDAVATLLGSGRQLPRVAWFALARLLSPRVAGVLARLVSDSPIPPWIDAVAIHDRGLSVPPLRRRAFVDFRSELIEELRVGLPALLRFEDRNSMRYSIESRVPFLHRPLVSTILSYPASHIIGRDGTTKLVLREALRGIAPSEILARRDKIGFATPMSQWLATHDRLIAETVCVEAPRRFTVLSPDGTRRLYRAAQGGDRRAVASTWRIFALTRWMQLRGIRAA